MVFVWAIGISGLDFLAFQKLVLARLHPEHGFLVGFDFFEFFFEKQVQSSPSISVESGTVIGPTVWTSAWPVGVIVLSFSVSSTGSSCSVYVSFLISSWASGNFFVFLIFGFFDFSVFTF